MIRLLIADDEKTIRETICSIIDWKSLGIEVVGLCKNGLEAYDAILDEYPDIVLTDIRMPKLSGLELIKKITQNHDHIQFIIMSGYNEFSYAREAMHYGIKHYILKPCSETEIIEAVKDCIKEYYRSLSIEELQKSTFLSEEKLMFNILFQTFSSNQDLSMLPGIFESYIDFYHTSYQLYYIFFLEEYLVQSCIEKICCLFRDNSVPFSFSFIYVKNTLIFFYIDTGKNYASLDNALNNLFQSSDYSLCTFQRDSFPSLLAMLEILYKKVKRFETIYLYSGAQCTIICNYDFMFQQLTDISDKLLQVQSESSRRELINELKKLLSSVKDINLLRSMINSLVVKAAQSSSSYNPNEITDIIQFVNTITVNSEICNFIFDKLDSLFSIDLVNQKKYKPFIQEILNYTNAHISDPNLTLKWIVENHLYMNVDYVSRQFVLQTGQKFSSYLNEIRIKKAKQLLISCDSEKIYHVAEQVGCGNNPQYFSHLFKKYTKLTPKEYIAKMKTSLNHDI